MLSVVRSFDKSITWRGYLTSSWSLLLMAIRDPRGMMRIRLAWEVSLLGPTTISSQHNETVRRCCGVKSENIIISPLAMTCCSEWRWREFGTTVIDMGGGQTTVASMRAQELVTNIYSWRWQYITKDISKFWDFNADCWKRLSSNFGNTDEEANETETVK